MSWSSLPQEIPFAYEIVDSTSLEGVNHKGAWIRLSRREAEARLEDAVPPFTNINMKLLDIDGHEMPGTLYGKVLDNLPGSSCRFSIRFTSVTPQFETLLPSVAKAGEEKGVSERQPSTAS